MFYTNVVRKGNQLLYRGYDENGVQVTNRIKYRPTMYVPSTDGETRFKAMDGTPVKPMTFDSMKDCREFTDMYQDTQFTVYGNNNHIAACIRDLFPGTIEFHPDLIRVLNFDIETESDRGFPEPDAAEMEILTITAKLSTDEEAHVWGLKPYDEQKFDYTHSRYKKIVYHQFTSEVGLLKHFVAWWAEQRADVLTGWNILFFDIPYIVNRITKVLGEEATKMLSPWRLIQRGSVVNNGRKRTTFDIQGISTLDYSDLVKKFTKNTLGELENYKLGTVGKEVLGIDKVDYSDLETLTRLYNEDFQRFVDYNIMDVELVDRLDDKLGLLNLVFTMSYKCGVNYTATLGTTTSGTLPSSEN